MPMMHLLVQTTSEAFTPASKTTAEAQETLQMAGLYLPGTRILRSKR